MNSEGTRSVQPLSAGSSSPPQEGPDWFEGLPKVELHLHLEGAIPVDAMLELVKKYSPPGEAPGRDELLKRFHFQDFTHFIETWCWKNRFLREYEDFSFIAEALVQDLRAKNYLYGEVYFSPADFSGQGLRAGEIARAIRKGLSRVPEVEIALIADMVRDYGAERAAGTLREAWEARGEGIIGIGIGGSEQSYPPRLFRDVYEEARSLGFHTTAHAGEVAGGASIWGALKDLKVERIGHGTRAGEDESLLEYLAEHQVPLEMCPLSNCALRVVPSYEAHPVRAFFERGLCVTVNTDDPLMFGNTLAQEFRLLYEKLGFSLEEICTLIENAVRASWLAGPKKAELLRMLRSHSGWRGKKA
jgi:adenosine deaminase